MVGMSGTLIAQETQPFQVQIQSKFYDFEFVRLEVQDLSTTENIEVQKQEPTKWMCNISPNQPYTFTVFYGVAEIHSQVTIPESSSLLIDLDVVLLDEVTVTSTKVERPFEIKDNTLVVNVESEELKSFTNAMEVIQNAPAVSLDELNGTLEITGKTATIFLNGKEVNLSGSSLVDFLSNMDKNNIKNIEIITNPSAAYDARIDRVINITLNKVKNGKDLTTVKTVSGTRTNPYTKNTIGYQMQKSKVRLNADFTQDYNRMFSNANITADDTYNSISKNTTNSYQGQLFLDFDLSEKSLVDLSIYYKKNDEVINQQTDGLLNNQGFSVDTQDENDVLNANILYQNNLNDSTTLKLTADYAYFEGQTLNTITNTDSRTLQTLPTQIPIFRVGGDFIKDKQNGGYTFGYKYSNVNVTNDNRQTFAQGTVLSDFKYKEDVFALYFNKDYAWKNYSLSAGLRAEYSLLNANYETEEYTSTSESDLLNLSPTLTFSIFTEKQRYFEFSLTSQTTRPSYALLNPFNQYDSDITTFEGNAELKPQQEYNFSFNYAYGNTFLGLNSSYYNNFISTYLDNVDGNFVNKYNNFDHVFVSYLAQYQKFNISEKVNLSFQNVIGFTLVNEEGFELPKGTPFFQNATSLIYNPTSKLSFTSSFSYSSPFKDGFFRHRGYGFLNLYAKYQFEKPNIRLSLFAKDVFKSRMEGADVILPGVNYQVQQYNDAFNIGLSFTWTIGEVFKHRRKNTDTFDEFDRISN